MSKFFHKIAGLRNGLRQAALSVLQFGPLLAHKQPILVEIGGRGGPSFGWRLLVRFNFIKIHGFEPDPVEAIRLGRKTTYSEVHPVAIGGKNGDVPLYLTAHRGCSSLRKPLLDKFSEKSILAWLQVDKTTNVKVATLECLVEEGRLPLPDFLAIDAQGAEKDILESSGEALSNVLGISMECRSFPMYEDEATFEELRIILDGLGFILRDLKVVGSFDELAYEFDCYFSREYSQLKDRQLSLLKWWERMHRLRKPVFATTL